MCHQNPRADSKHRWKSYPATVIGTSYETYPEARAKEKLYISEDLTTSDLNDDQERSRRPPGRYADSNFISDIKSKSEKKADSSIKHQKKQMGADTFKADFRGKSFFSKAVSNGKTLKKRGRPPKNQVPPEKVLLPFGKPSDKLVHKHSGSLPSSSDFSPRVVRTSPRKALNLGSTPSGSQEQLQLQPDFLSVTSPRVILRRSPRKRHQDLTLQGNYFPTPETNNNVLPATHPFNGRSMPVRNSPTEEYQVQSQSLLSGAGNFDGQPPAGPSSLDTTTPISSVIKDSLNILNLEEEPKTPDLPAEYGGSDYGISGRETSSDEEETQTSLVERITQSKVPESTVATPSWTGTEPIDLNRSKQLTGQAFDPISENGGSNSAKNSKCLEFNLEDLPNLTRDTTDLATKKFLNRLKEATIVMYGEIGKLTETLKDINNKLDHLSGEIVDIKDCLQGFQGQPPKKKVKYDSSLPIDSEERLLEFEEKMKSEEMKYGLIKELSQLSGNTIANLVTSIMNYLITDHMLLCFTWKGKTGKKSFCDHILTPVIKEAVKTNKYVQWNATAAENAIENRILFTNKRIERKEKKAAAAQKRQNSNNSAT